MYACSICNQMKSQNRNHNKCLLKQCIFCRKLLLRKTHWFDHIMKLDFCDRAMRETKKMIQCGLCSKDVPQSCIETHSLICKRLYECKDCGTVLHARSAKSLQVVIKKHRCYSKMCKICYLTMPPNDFKKHACQLKNVSYHDVYNR